MRAFRSTVLFLILASCGGSTTAPGAATSPSTPTSPDNTQQGCARTSVGLTPLTDLGAGGTYQGQRGGLYPSGSNTMPREHLSDGISLSIQPRDPEGRPAASGKYVFISIGMSNTTQEFSTFKPMADADSLRNPSLVIVDGAQGGMTGTNWNNAGCSCWTTLDDRLRAAGVTAAQVATAWIKIADAGPSEGWPAHAQRLRDETIGILQKLATRFPNLRLAYLSSRIYAGYATSNLNPEPYAYQSAFAVRWTIEQQLNGGLPFAGPGRAAPWVAWGPYLWADGLTPRGDGLTWSCSDFANDGTHPGSTGRQKVAARLLDFVHTDPTARQWYLARP